jgi:PLD-like domain
VPESIAIAAYANCDDTYVVWRYPEPISECRGFALIRKGADGKEEPIHTFVPFAGEPHEDGEHHPSTVWPIQRFAWTDTFARSQETLSYKVVPMVGKAGALSEATDHASQWTEPVEVTADAGDGISAYFNRGVISTQAISRRLEGEEPWTKKLAEMIETKGDDTRNYLSGELRLAMLGLLDEAKANEKAEIYLALFELDDPELIAELEAFGPRAHVVLANGPKEKQDKSKAAREKLREKKVEVHDRMTVGGLAHNKFMVICEKGVPQRVWTGSTNWSMTGLCTQVNNGILIESEAVGKYYVKQWEDLVKAGNDFTEELKDGDGTKHEATLGKAKIGTWFVPVHDTVDLTDARKLIAAAEEGVLFLFFYPGQDKTLFNAIMDRADPKSSQFDPKLYVHGVANQNPEGRSKDPDQVNLIHRGQLDEADPDVVLPGRIDKRFAGWDKELSGFNIVVIHSKVIVLDPFGKAPLVMTGSHNLGPKASEENDDNLNLISGAPKLAGAYATHIIAVYNDFRWRYVRSQAAAKAKKAWEGPEDGKAWQDSYYSGKDAAAKQRELAFWLGES